ncbi:MAG: TIGR00282 family metallophosphoesterase [Ruminococcaceae bacterium]|nr:TIGR00282 family metallophosphoesterase [Oscillospiraceae bacterium]
MGNFKILCLGDAVGPAALEAISKNLASLRKKYGADMVIINGENVSSGNGIMPDEADQLFYSGVDVITGGNHIWQKNRIYSYLDDTSEIIRPANYPPSNPGHGYTIVNMGAARVLVMNVLGTVFMESLACPFETVDKILEREKGNYDISVLDIHAEATAEKKSLAYYLDGRVNVIFGTHTHVATADEQVLPKGSGYITDLGMCGCQESCLGVEAEIIIDKLKSKMPARFKLAEGDITLCGALFELDENFKAVSVTRIKEREL